MRRSNIRDASDRVTLSLARATLDKKPDDKPKMQEVDVRLHYEEKTTAIEHIHPYGFTAVPKGRKKENGASAAEAIVGFMDGNRSHGVALVIGDRRYRLTELEEGEVALHDDQKQKAHFKRDGLFVEGGPKKLPQTFIVGDMKVTHTKEKTTIELDKTIWTLEKDKITSDVNGTKIIQTPTKITAYADSKLPVIITKNNIFLGGEEDAKKVLTVAGPSEVILAVMEKK